MVSGSEFEKQHLEAHVEMCHQRYESLERRLSTIEQKVESIHKDIVEGNKSMMKVLVGAAATVVAGLLSTIIVIMVQGLG